MNGYFAILNPETIEEELTGLWRTSFKLAKSLGDSKGPVKTCEMLKAKVEKFQTHLPVIQVRSHLVLPICRCPLSRPI